jgi:hypothetical protein
MRLLALAAISASLAFGQTSLNPSGTWNWRCCQGRHSGTFVIDHFDAGGTFSGRFGNTADDARTPIAGRISGSRIEFTRTFGSQTQRWVGSLSSTGGGLRSSGTWSGYGLSPGGANDFSADLARPAAAPSPTPDPEPISVPGGSSTLVGQWRWTCCANVHSGTFTIQDQTPEGHFRGVFGASASDGSTPFAGTYRNGTVVFTRFVLTGAIAQPQQWRAGVAGAEMQNGRLSGYGISGQESFQAAKVR